MRMSVAVGAAVLAVMGSIDAAEARARIRLPFGRTVTPQRAVMPAPAPTGFAGRIGYQPAVTIAPGRAAAAATLPLATSSDENAGSESTARARTSAVVPPVAPPRIREVRAIAPPCEAGKRVGGVEHENAGFCLIN